MKRFFATLAAVSAVAISAPAAAQPGYGQGQYRGGGYADANLSARIDQLQLRLQTGVQSGSISRREAMTLRQQLSQLSQLDRRYARGGYDGRERADLQRRVNEVRMAIRRADRNNQARWNDYDREDGYGRDGRWNDRYDDRGPYDQPRTGLGGVVDGLLGGGGLRVGQRASTDLRMLDRGYRNQYRDDDHGYYRTDGRQIYQIDARTNTVVRVYPMNR